MFWRDKKKFHNPVIFTFYDLFVCSFQGCFGFFVFLEIQLFFLSISLRGMVFVVVLLGWEKVFFIIHKQIF